MKKNTPQNKISERIETLEKQSEEMLDTIKGEFEITKRTISDLTKLILGIGGGILLSVIILRSFIGKSPNSFGKGRRRVIHRFRDELGRELSDQAASYLLDIAKNKLQSYIHQNPEDDEGSDDPGRSQKAE